jgi:hypothetical protein
VFCGESSVRLDKVEWRLRREVLWFCIVPEAGKSPGVSGSKNENPRGNDPEGFRGIAADLERPSSQYRATMGAAPPKR